jgi:hypothetical protein
MNLAVELLAAPVVACGAAGAITLLYVHNYSALWLLLIALPLPLW